MSIIKFWKAVFCFGWLPLFFDTESSSDSSQSSVTDTQDNRIAAAADSVNVNTSRSTGGSVNIVSTDQGTVSKAFDFAKLLTTNAAKESAASAAQNTAVTTTAMQSVKDAYANESDTLAAAYTTAKAGEQKVMVAAGLAIVGIVALKVLGKGA